MGTRQEIIRVLTLKGLSFLWSRDFLLFLSFASSPFLLNAMWMVMRSQLLFLLFLYLYPQEHPGIYLYLFFLADWHFHLRQSVSILFFLKLLGHVLPYFCLPLYLFASSSKNLNFFCWSCRVLVANLVKSASGEEVLSIGSSRSPFLAGCFASSFFFLLHNLLFLYIFSLSSASSFTYSFINSHILYLVIFHPFVLSLFL